MYVNLFVFLLLVTYVLGFVSPRAESQNCVQHVQAYKDGFTSSEPWAIQMFDSSTKIPSGLLYGNLVQLGNFDECLTVDEKSLGFSGRWCRVVITKAAVMDRNDDDYLLSMRELMLLPLKHILVNASSRDMTSRSGITLPSRFPPLQWSVCAPSTCHSDGISDVLSFNMEQIGISATSDVVTASCFSYGDSQFALDASSWGCISLLLLLLVLVIVSTAYEMLVIVPSDKKFPYPALLAFSLRGNMSHLFHISRRPKPGTLSCLHGLRVLSMAWVLLGHRYNVQMYMPNINVIDLFQYAEHWTNMIVVNAFLSVETFFVLSGLLATYVACRNQNLGRSFSFINYYVYRYVRLTAPLAVYVFYVATLSDRVVHGPMWDQIIIPAAAGCRSNWWAALLYVNNYVDNKICGGQTWYLSVDMQLSWLAPLIIVPLLRWPKPTMCAIGGLALASTIALFTTTMINELFWTNPFTIKEDKAVEYWSYIYGNTPMRAVPYLFGMALGWILNERWGQEGKWVPKWAWYLGWLLNTTICLATIFTLVIAYLPDYKYNVVDAAFYGSLHRVAWSLSISWVIYACVTGHGGPVNYLLSWRMWEPFSKLTYCAFLTHYLIVFMDGGLWRNPHYFSNFSSIHTFLGDLFLVFAASLVLYLLVEAPVTVLLRELLGKDKPVIVKPLISITEAQQSGNRCINDPRHSHI